MNFNKAQHSTSARWKIKILRQNLEELYVRADPRDFRDPEVASDLGRYLCVRVSGYLEQAVATILRDFCDKNSWGQVRLFAHSGLEKMPNLNSDALLKLVGRFDSAWAAELRDYLSVEERKNSLNALVGMRNDVAHGKQQGLSRERAWDYFETADEIVEWMLAHFDSMNEGRS